MKFRALSLPTDGLELDCSSSPYRWDLSAKLEEREAMGFEHRFVKMDGQSDTSHFPLPGVGNQSILTLIFLILGTMWQSNGQLSLQVLYLESQSCARMFLSSSQVGRSQICI
ncbi:uncharacterized protein LOC116208362 isoform X2 [Punica granatum]|uniref:Uncharacterized protein LOC116208362 isoform X2 n=1 Tax=Punica granatum TaxID=22663 RepID=A0A6P8DWN1_PUNGR|nr:uncharacterized protein LOC116208362 isoform X2 [Punica granatum]